MKKFLQYINEKVLLKVASLNTVLVFIKMLAGFITTKAIAVFIGAEGMAFIGNLRNFLSATQSFSTLGLYSGLVKFIGEFKNVVIELSKVLSTAFYAGFLASIISSLCCYYNAQVINDFLFSSDYNYAYIIKVMAIALPFYSLNIFTFSILNGFSKFRMLLVVNIVGQIFGASITVFLIWQNRIDGALLSVVITESLLFFITLVGIINQRSLMPLIKVKSISYDFVKGFSSHSVMALFSAILLPLVALFIRSYLIDNVGIKDAGYWEAMNRISKYYLLFITSLLSLYILPRFSEINSIEEFRKEILNFYKTIIPVFTIVLIVIYLLRSVIVSLILTDDFKPVEDLFFWQLFGDLIKVLATVIALQFLAKKMFWHYIITEAFLIITLYLTSVYLIDIFSLKGAVIAHFVTYLLYYAIILTILSSKLFGVETKEY